MFLFRRKTVFFGSGSGHHLGSLCNALCAGRTIYGHGTWVQNQADILQETLEVVKKALSRIENGYSSCRKHSDAARQRGGSQPPGAIHLATPAIAHVQSTTGFIRSYSPGSSRIEPDWGDELVWRRFPTAVSPASSRLCPRTKNRVSPAGNLRIGNPQHVGLETCATAGHPVAPFLMAASLYSNCQWPSAFRPPAICLSYTTASRPSPVAGLRRDFPDLAWLRVSQRAKGIENSLSRQEKFTTIFGRGRIPISGRMEATDWKVRSTVPRATS